MISRANLLQPLNGNDDHFWMEYAYSLALKAREEGEVPVGAVLISHDNKILGQAGNRVIQTQDPSAHAEMLAIREASSYIQNYRLLDATLYVTLEPCCMCAGLLIHSRIKRLVFATRDVRAGAAGSAYNLLHADPLNHSIQIDEGFLQEKCATLLTDFFKSKRTRKNMAI